MSPPVILRQSKHMGTRTEPFLLRTVNAASNFRFVRHTAQHGEEPRYDLAGAREFSLLEIV